jgi:hypothetical protein
MLMTGLQAGAKEEVETASRAVPVKSGSFPAASLGKRQSAVGSAAAAQMKKPIAHASGGQATMLVSQAQVASLGERMVADVAAVDPSLVSDSKLRGNANQKNNAAALASKPAHPATVAEPPAPGKSAPATSSKANRLSSAKAPGAADVQRQQRGTVPASAPPASAGDLPVRGNANRQNNAGVPAAAAAQKDFNAPTLLSR